MSAIECGSQLRSWSTRGPGNELLSSRSIHNKQVPLTHSQSWFCVSRLDAPPLSLFFSRFPFVFLHVAFADVLFCTSLRVDLAAPSSPGTTTMLHCTVVFQSSVEFSGGPGTYCLRPCHVCFFHPSSSIWEASFVAAIISKARDGRNAVVF